MEDELLLLSEIRDKYRLSPSTLRTALERGKLTGRKMGYFWLIDVKSQQFKNWLANRPAPGQGRKKASGSDGN